MAFSNTAIRYGGVTKFFHWLTALLILTLIALGLYASDLPHDTQDALTRKAWFFSLHKTLGVTVFFVALARIAWISHAAASGFAPIWWPLGQSLPFIPKNTSLEHAFGAVHIIAGKLLIGALVLHVAGAVKHHVIDRDSTLRRMLPGEPAIGPLPAQHHSAAPVVTATVVWIAAIGLGLGLGLGQPADTEETATLDAVASEWQVQNGTIALEVTQFGSVVAGSFADWTSAITFDETVQTGKAGEVTTTVAIPTLSLGSVTDQAMGADFFNTEAFPTATFQADINVAADGYIAAGTLTIKDQSIPVELPFTLTLQDDTAQMTGTTTLDRRDFGIGETVTDESTLAFSVTVNIDLTATRGQ